MIMNFNVFARKKSCLIKVLSRHVPGGSHNVAGRTTSTERSNDIIRNRTHDLPACSIVLQPTTLPRASGI
jgi:hypothetical protein